MACIGEGGPAGGTPGQVSGESSPARLLALSGIEGCSPSCHHTRVLPLCLLGLRPSAVDPGTAWALSARSKEVFLQGLVPGAGLLGRPLQQLSPLRPRLVLGRGGRTQPSPKPCRLKSPQPGSLESLTPTPRGACLSCDRLAQNLLDRSEKGLAVGSV